MSVISYNNSDTWKRGNGKAVNSVGFLYLERGSACVICLIGLIRGVGEARQPPDVGLGTGSLRITYGVPGNTQEEMIRSGNLYCQNY